LVRWEERFRRVKYDFLILSFANGDEGPFDGGFDFPDDFGVGVVLRSLMIAEGTDVFVKSSLVAIPLDAGF
jgi:hypothetical protein